MLSWWKREIELNRFYVGGISFVSNSPYAYTLVGEKYIEERERDHHYFSIFARQHCCRFVHLRTLHFLVCLWTNAHIERRAHSFLYFFAFGRERLYMRMFSVSMANQPTHILRKILCANVEWQLRSMAATCWSMHIKPRVLESKRKTQFLLLLFFIDNLFSSSSSRSSFSFSLLHVRY